MSRKSLKVRGNESVKTVSMLINASNEFVSMGHFGKLKSKRPITNYYFPSQNLTSFLWSWSKIAVAVFIKIGNTWEDKSLSWSVLTLLGESFNTLAVIPQANMRRYSSDADDAFCPFVQISPPFDIDENDWKRCPKRLSIPLS